MLESTQISRSSAMINSTQSSRLGVIYNIFDNFIRYISRCILPYLNGIVDLHVVSSQLIDVETIVKALPECLTIE